jgi:hypothetical protein
MHSNDKAVVDTRSPISRAKPSPQSHVLVADEELFLRLQRTAGNEAVSSLMTVSPVLQRTPEAATQTMPTAEPADTAPVVQSGLASDHPLVASGQPANGAVSGPAFNAEVDRRFWERTHYRIGERLRKDRPEDAPHIREWLTIRDEVRAERQSKEHPSHTAKPAAASPLPASGLESLQNQGFGRWLLRFQGYTEAGAVASYLWPRGAPKGVQINPTVVVTEPVQIGEFELRNVTFEAIQTMEPWVRNRFVQEMQGIEPQPSPTQPAGPKGTRGVPFPDIDIENESQLMKWLEGQLEDIHRAAHLLEIGAYATAAIKNIAYARAVAQVGVDAAEGVGWGGAGVEEVAALEEASVHAEIAEALGELAGPVGAIALIVWVGIQVITAFAGEKKEAGKLGVAYGTVWAALGEPRHLPKFEPGISYSPEEFREAFVEGVQEGEEKASEVGKKIRRYVLGSMIKEDRDEGVVASELLWDIMNRAPKGPRQPWSFLGWPTPYDFDPLLLGQR